MGPSGETTSIREARANRFAIKVKRHQQEVMPEEGSWEWYNQYADRTPRVSRGDLVLPEGDTQSKDFVKRREALDFFVDLYGKPRQLIFRGVTEHKPWRVSWVVRRTILHDPPSVVHWPPEKLMCQYTPDLVRYAAHKRATKKEYMIDPVEAYTCGPTVVLSKHRKFAVAYAKFQAIKENYEWIGVVKPSSGPYELRVRS